MGTVVSKQCHKMDVLEAALMETLNTPTLSLKLENPYRTFRTAREIEKDGHGNYISGVIEFNPAPKSDEVFRLELSLVPAEDASQNSHGIHPNLLSITIKDKNKRIKYRGNLTNPKAWKLVLLITNGQVYYQDHEGNLLKADDLVNGNKLLLGNYAETGMEHVLITVVTPLKRKESNGALTVGKVVEECPYCQIKKNQPLNELLKNNLAIQRKRKRRDRNDSSYESGSNLGSPLSIIADHDENSTAPRAIALSVPGPIQTLPTLNWNDEDFNQIVNPPTNCAPTFVMDFGLEEFGTNPGNVMDGPLVKDGGESNTETVTDSEIDSDYDNSDYESSETESNNNSSSNDEEEYRVVEQLDELCNGTNALKMDE